MLVPLSLLKKYVPVSLPPAELAHALTMAGTEIGEVSEVGAGWDRDKVLVGHVLRVDPHPDADRLTLPTVDLGGETKTVVCGAPNVAPGQKIAFAHEGARLYSYRSRRVEPLKAAKIRGVLSAGMVCSVLELGLGEDHDGILVLDDDAPTGAPLADVLGDAVLDAEITPNRPDCLSLLGVAHEVAAITGETVTEPDLSYPEDDGPIEDRVEIEIADPDLCGRYTASLIAGVKVGPSPEVAPGRSDAPGPAADQQHRRRDELRDDGVRPAAARLRSRHDRGADGRGQDRAAGGVARDAG